MSRRARILLTIALSLLGGAAAAAITVVIMQNDMLHRWEALPFAPAGARLATIWEMQVYAQAPDGQIYTIDPGRADAWEPVDAIPTSVSDDRLSRPVGLGPCDRSDLRFRWHAAAPADERSCLESRWFMSIVTATLSVIEDSRGQLWYFRSVPVDFAVPALLNLAQATLIGVGVGYATARAITG